MPKKAKESTNWHNSVYRDATDMEVVSPETDRPVEIHPDSLEMLTIGHRLKDCRELASWKD